MCSSLIDLDSKPPNTITKKRSSKKWTCRVLSLKKEPTTMTTQRKTIKLIIETPPSPMTST